MSTKVRLISTAAAGNSYAGLFDKPGEYLGEAPSDLAGQRGLVDRALDRSGAS